MRRFLPPSRRSFLETTLAVAAGFFAVLAAAWPDWVEAFGFDPDSGNGSLEWAVPVVLAVAALILAPIARRHWRTDGVKAAGT
jgi:hypothetical protein